MYCTVVWVDPALGLVNSRRKLMPTGAERIAWGNGDLSRAPVVDTRLGRIGTAICWQNYMPLLRMYMYRRGCRFGARRPLMRERPGKRPCATSRSRAAVSC